MNRSILTIALAMTTAALAAAVVYPALREPPELNTWKRKASALDKYCNQKRVLLEHDRGQLQDPRFRDVSFQVLREGVPFWDLQEIWMCVGYEMRLDRRTQCIIDRDLKCVTTMWKTIEDAIRRPRY